MNLPWRGSGNLHGPWTIRNMAQSHANKSRKLICMGQIFALHDALFTLSSLHALPALLWQSFTDHLGWCHIPGSRLTDKKPLAWCNSQTFHLTSQLPTHTVPSEARITLSKDTSVWRSVTVLAVAHLTSNLEPTGIAPFYIYIYWSQPAMDVLAASICYLVVVSSWKT